ncbi:hypothetical protein [Providencia rettgeri]|nr:hypothetical protein [Providencia rettgeri]
MSVSGTHRLGWVVVRPALSDKRTLPTAFYVNPRGTGYAMFKNQPVLA